jgi:hypothetical protein
MNVIRTPGARNNFCNKLIKPERRCMFGNRRHHSFIAMAFVVLPAWGGIDPRGYLPTVGPAPIRFSIPLLSVAKVFIPSAPPQHPAPEPPKTAKIELAPAPPAAAAVPEPPAVINHVSSVVPESVAPDEVISPQMLIKYFSKSTNGVSSSVTAPMDFTPPKPAEQPSSKATYSTGP